MKEGEEEKTKTYSALIWTDKAIQREDIAFLDDIKVAGALVADLNSTCPGALGKNTCTHGPISCSVLGFCCFFLNQGFSCYRDFRPTLPSFPSHSSRTGGWLLAETTNPCVMFTSQEIKSSKPVDGRRGNLAPAPLSLP